MKTTIQKFGQNRIISILKRTMLIVMSMTIWLCSIGAGIDEYDYPKLSLKDNHVYKVCDLDKSTLSTYDDCDVAVNLIVDSVDGKEIEARTDGGIKILLEGTKAVKDSYEANESITVFGTLKVSKNKKQKKSIETQWTSSSSVDLKADYYTVVDGHPKAYYEKDTVSYTLNNGAVEYRVPESWNAKALLKPEKKGDLFNKKLTGSAECFILGELLPNPDAHEYFLVFYLDKERFVSETKWDNPSEIETAIIKNICPETGFNNIVAGAKKNIFKDKAVSDQGNNIIYYVTNYKDPNGSKGSCKVEFIITEAEKGFVVMMYVTDAGYSFREDVLYIQKSLQINQ